MAPLKGPTASGVGLSRQGTRQHLRSLTATACRHPGLTPVQDRQEIPPPARGRWRGIRPDLRQPGRRRQDGGVGNRVKKPRATEPGPVGISPSGGQDCLRAIVDKATGAGATSSPTRSCSPTSRSTELLVEGKIAADDQRVLFSPISKAKTTATGSDGPAGSRVRASAARAESASRFPKPTRPGTRPSSRASRMSSATFKRRYKELRGAARLFSDTFYDTTLPPEVVEAVAANLTILKSPTVLRQHDGRLWCWEGCNDDHGCCAGSCTHVWNYAQAICHLFPVAGTEPAAERVLRGQDAPRAARPSVATAHLARRHTHLRRRRRPARRDHEGPPRMADLGDRQWLERFWPRIRKSMDYMIAKWDPTAHGAARRIPPQHLRHQLLRAGRHCGSFYLGALAAMVRMGRRAGTMSPSTKSCSRKALPAWRRNCTTASTSSRSCRRKG
jgi:hypothetical protein